MNLRTTISLPKDLLTEFQSIVGSKKSFSEQVRIAMTAYIEKHRRAQYLQEMEASYKKNAEVLKKSAEEHKAFREESTNSITSSL